jgi:hypothetical protein
MRIIYVLLLSSIVLVMNAFGQENTKLLQMQGVWDYTMNTDTVKSYKIVVNKSCLDFSYKVNNDEITLLEMIIGFQNIAAKYDETEFIHIDSLKENGLFFTEIVDKEEIGQDGLINKAFCMIASYYECDGELLAINGGKLFEYEKISELSYGAIKKLYNRGKQDNRNYLKDYLNLKVQSIKPVKCVLYSQPNKPTKARLNSDDVVIVIEGTSKWIKVKYSEEGFGWVKKDDLK